MSETEELKMLDNIFDNEQVLAKELTTLDGDKEDYVTQLCCQGRKKFFLFIDKHLCWPLLINLQKHNRSDMLLLYLQKNTLQGNVLLGEQASLDIPAKCCYVEHIVVLIGFLYENIKPLNNNEQFINVCINQLGQQFSLSELITVYSVDTAQEIYPLLRNSHPDIMTVPYPHFDGSEINSRKKKFHPLYVIDYIVTQHKNPVFKTINLPGERLDILISSILENLPNVKLFTDRLCEQLKGFFKSSTSAFVLKELTNQAHAYFLKHYKLDSEQYQAAYFFLLRLYQISNIKFDIRELCQSHSCFIQYIYEKKPASEIEITFVTETLCSYIDKLKNLDEVESILKTMDTNQNFHAWEQWKLTVRVLTRIKKLAKHERKFEHQQLLINIFDKRLNKLIQEQQKLTLLQDANCNPQEKINEILKLYDGSLYEIKQSIAAHVNIYISYLESQVTSATELDDLKQLLVNHHEKLRLDLKVIYVKLFHNALEINEYKWANALILEIQTKISDPFLPMLLQAQCFKDQLNFVETYKRCNAILEGQTISPQVIKSKINPNNKKPNTIYVTTVGMLDKMTGRYSDTETLKNYPNISATFLAQDGSIVTKLLDSNQLERLAHECILVDYSISRTALRNNKHIELIDKRSSDKRKTVELTTSIPCSIRTEFRRAETNAAMSTKFSQYVIETVNYGDYFTPSEETKYKAKAMIAELLYMGNIKFDISTPENIKLINGDLNKVEDRIERAIQAYEYIKDLPKDNELKNMIICALNGIDKLPLPRNVELDMNSIVYTRFHAYYQVKNKKLMEHSSIEMLEALQKQMTALEQSNREQSAAQDKKIEELTTVVKDQSQQLRLLTQLLKKQIKSEETKTFPEETTEVNKNERRSSSSPHFLK